jgi:hypothetical protein
MSTQDLNDTIQVRYRLVNYGGKSHRKMKKRLGMTQLCIQNNQMKFGKVRILKCFQ